MKGDAAARPAGFYADLEQLLLRQLGADPGQMELRLKLLEVYCETVRSADFAREVRALGPLVRQPERAEDWDRIASMARMLGLVDPVFAQAAPMFFESSAAAAATRTRTLLLRRIGEDGRYREPFAALTEDCRRLQADAAFRAGLDDALARLALRPSPLQEVPRLAKAGGGARIFLKREDLAPPGWRLMVMVAGQALVAQRLGRGTLVTSTTTGARGLMAAQVGAQLGLGVVVFMDHDDQARYRAEAFRMRLLGAEVRGVSRRDLPTRDVRCAALDYWAQEPAGAFPVMGLDGAPPPYDLMTRDIPSVVGRETRRQLQALAGREPDLMVARGSERADAVGWLEPFLCGGARLVCVEAARILMRRRDELPGMLPGPSPDAQRRMEQAEMAQLELAPVAREHGLLRASGRVEYVPASGEAGRKALVDLPALEGVVVSIETAQAIGLACREAAKLKPEQAVVVMVAESPEADLPEIVRLLEGQLPPPRLAGLLQR